MALATHAAGLHGDGVSAQTQTVMVTGATAGIGRATAREIARQGARVVIVGRSESRCQATVDEVRRAARNEQVEYLLADLSSLAETRAMATQFKARYERLDVLVNNVGAVFMEFGETAEGIERTFALNHLSGYFLLTNELLDVLKHSAPARIVNVSSDTHTGGKVVFGQLEMRDNYSGFRQYSNTKLMNILFTKMLARRLETAGVTANALHPGFVASNFGATNNDKWWVRPAMKFMHLFAISEDQGAETSVHLATSPDVEGVTGKYFVKCREKTPAVAALAEADQHRLWEASEEMVVG